MIMKMKLVIKKASTMIRKMKKKKKIEKRSLRMIMMLRRRMKERGKKGEVVKMRKTTMRMKEIKRKS